MTCLSYKCFEQLVPGLCIGVLQSAILLYYRAGCSKQMTSLVNNLLKFQTLISEIRFSHFFQQKTSVYLVF